MQMRRDKIPHSYKSKHRAALVFSVGVATFFLHFTAPRGEQRSFSVYAEEGRESARDVTKAPAEGETKAGESGAAPAPLESVPHTN